MKKLTTTILAVLLLTVCFCTTVFAEKPTLTVSDEYRKLDIDGAGYTLYNIYPFNEPEIEERSFTGCTVYTKTEEGYLVDTVSVRNNLTNSIIQVIYTFESGARVTLHYLRNDCIAEADRLLAGESDNYVVDFKSWDTTDDAATTKEALYGETVTLTPDGTYFTGDEVEMRTKDWSLSLPVGALIYFDDTYYFVDYKEAGAEDLYYSELYNLTSFPAHEITDPALLLKIEEELGSDDFDYILEDDSLIGIAAAFLIFIFAVIPFAIFVTCLIFAIRAKGVYKSLFGLVCALTAAELSVFATITALILLLG